MQLFRVLGGNVQILGSGNYDFYLVPMNIDGGFQVDPGSGKSYYEPIDLSDYDENYKFVVYSQFGCEDGIGVDNEEFMAGMVALSVPVMNLEGEICFTVAVHAPSVRRPLTELRQYVPSLRRAAAAMAANYCNPEDNDG